MKRSRVIPELIDPPRRKRYVAKRDRFEAGVRALIEAGVAKGQFECADTRLAGFTVLGAINWIPKWYQPGGRRPYPFSYQRWRRLSCRSCWRPRHPRTGSWLPAG